MSATPLRRPRFTFGAGPQIVVVVLVVLLAGAMAIQPTRQLLAQRGRIRQMEAELARTEHANRMLEAYIARLNDPDYIEQRARSQLGLVRPGETAFVVMPPRKRAAKRKGAGKHRAQVVRHEPSFVERVLEFIGLP